MSYPGPLSGSVNLSCDTALQRSADNFLFQLNDGSATTESTLVSPASITAPSANGNVSLAMTTTTPGDSNLTMVGQDTIISMTNQGGVNQINMTGQNASINLSTNGDATVSIVGGGSLQTGTSTILLGSTAAGGVNDILFGNPTTTGIALYQSTAVPGQLSVGNNFTGANIASFNQTTNNVVLGSLLTAGTVNLNASTVIKESASGVNGLGLSPVSATNSIISQTIASGGTLGIGSSTAFPQTLRVSDVPYLGSACYVEVFGTAGAIPLFIAAAQGIAGECGIHPDAIAGTASLLLGSDNTNVSAIRIANQATTINNLGGAPQVLLASGTIAPGASGNIPAPTGEGLYCIMGCSTAPSSGQTRQGQVNVMAYVNSAGRIQMGGSGIADLGSIGGTDAFVLFPNDGLTTMFFQNNSSQSMVNYSIVAFKISGPILGTF